MDYRMEIAARVAELTGLQAEELAGYIEIPPNPEMGDYAFPCFRLAKSLRKAPPAIAAELSEKLTMPAGIERAEAKGGYLNFFADKAGFAEGVLSRVLREGERYGSSDMGAGKNVCVEFSSINIAKPFHIGQDIDFAVNAQQLTFIIDEHCCVV